MLADPSALALKLIETQRTLVLATADPAPWAAPVYYLHRDRRFYFFSSPSSRHITGALASARCAASIARDADDWRVIEGLQMEGVIAGVTDAGEGERIFAAYLERFPTVRTLIPDGPPTLERLTRTLRAALYAFEPRRTFYLNNAAGFGARREIQLR